jgi:hypothetical protein
MKPWKVTMHCHGQEGDWALSSDATCRVQLGDQQTLTIRVLGDLSFSVTLELPASSALLAIVEGLILINRELVGQDIPDWPAVEIKAEPVDPGCAATQAYGATGCT